MRKEIHQSYFIVMLAIGIIAGTILGLIFRINYLASPIFIILSTILLVFSYFRPYLILTIVVLIAGLVLAFFRISSELYGESYIRQFHGKTITVKGIIDGDAEVNGEGTNFKLSELHFGEGEVFARGCLYISEYNNKKLVRGNMVVLEGKLMEGFGTYSGYMYRPTIREILEPEPGDMVLRVRNWFADKIKKLIPEPEVNLGLSYLLGMKAGLPDDLSESLRVVGLVHIVVASGAHLSILVGIARKVFGKISRFAGLLFSILFILFFMSMVGFTPSILRAGVMSILTLLAWYVGRKFSPIRIITIVAALTLMINPMFIINLGWLLSFASYAGIMIIGPKLTKLFYGKKKPGFFGSTIVTTISATIMTLPVTLYFYGAVSLISILANLLILPTLPYAMGLVFFTGVVSGLPVIETLVSFIATKLLSFHILVVNFFGEMRQFMIEIPPYQSWVFWIYGIIFATLIALTIREKLLSKKNTFALVSSIKK